MNERQDQNANRSGWAIAGDWRADWDRLNPGSSNKMVQRSMSDESVLGDLLNRARNGDQAARELLFDRCRNYVSLLARIQVESWLQAKVDASDLVQQTLLEAYRGIGDFRGETEGEWLAWLKQILKHNATDFIRRYKGTAKRQIQRETPLETPGHGSSLFRYDPSDPGDTPSQLVLQHEDHIELADAVSQLADDYQEVILLRNVQRLSFSEVAERMDRSRPAVQMLWLRALNKLKDLLQDRGDA